MWVFDKKGSSRQNTLAAFSSEGLLETCLIQAAPTAEVTPGSPETWSEIPVALLSIHYPLCRCGPREAPVRTCPPREAPVRTCPPREAPVHTCPPREDPLRVSAERGPSARVRRERTLCASVCWERPLCASIHLERPLCASIHLERLIQLFSSSNYSICPSQ